jgi:hypothetical protein
MWPWNRTERRKEERENTQKKLEGRSKDKDELYKAENGMLGCASGTQYNASETKKAQRWSRTTVKSENDSRSIPLRNHIRQVAQQPPSQLVANSVCTNGRWWLRKF